MCIPRLSFLLVLALASSSISAQTMNERAQALTLIQQFLEKVCPSPATQGARTTISGKAEVEAEFNGLLRSLATLKGGIGGEAAKSKWEGLPQEDIAKALSSRDTCAVEMMKIIAPTLLPPATQSTAAPLPSAQAPTTRDPSPQATAPAGKVRYAAKSKYGLMVWRFGIHETRDACFTRISKRELIPLSGEQYSSITQPLECFRLPEQLTCSFESYQGGPAYPACYSTRRACEDDFQIVSQAIQGLKDGQRQVRRAECEDLDFKQAATQFELWSTPGAHRSGELPTVWALSKNVRDGGY